MPTKDSSSYIHRIGRTGRADKQVLPLASSLKKDAAMQKEMKH